MCTQRIEIYSRWCFYGMQSIRTHIKFKLERMKWARNRDREKEETNCQQLLTFHPQPINWLYCCEASKWEANKCRGKMDLQPSKTSISLTLSSSLFSVQNYLCVSLFSYILRVMSSIVVVVIRSRMESNDQFYGRVDDPKYTKISFVVNETKRTTHGREKENKSES